MSDYTDLITSEHADKPKFVATVDAATTPFVDLIGALNGMAADFDLDDAEGSQLDIVGEWVGISRNVAIPIQGVYFSLDTPAIGLDQGYWRRKFDPDQGLTSLPDEPYRTLLRATIALNHWDGTMPGLRAAITPLLGASNVYFRDNQDMTVTVIVAGPALELLTGALLAGGYLALKPEGVRFIYAFSSAPPAPVFALDESNTYLGGLDVGAWAVSAPPT